MTNQQIVFVVGVVCWERWYQFSAEQSNLFH